MARTPRPVTIDLSELAMALEDHTGMSWFIDRRTGEIFPVSEDMEDDALPEEFDEESDRFVFIEPMETREAWQQMSDFVVTVKEPRLRELLEVAIAGKGAFGRFKAVLARNAGKRQRWFEVHDRDLEERGRAWLSEHGIAFVPKQHAAAGGG